jgi:DNA-binding transcriptional MerR regulator
MELEPTAATGADTTSAATGPGNATASSPDPEPPAIPPVVQPDGDPRRPEQASPPAEPAPHPPEEAPAERPHGDPLRPAVRERPVARKEYYSIGEVSELAGLPAHVLRYWETQFPVLNPSKNRSGNRAYQRKEIKLILLVKHLLYEEKYTVEGAKAKLDQLRRGGLLAEHTAKALDSQTIALLREDVARLCELLAGM